MRRDRLRSFLVRQVELEPHDLVGGIEGEALVHGPVLERDVELVDARRATGRRVLPNVEDLFRAARQVVDSMPESGPPTWLAAVSTFSSSATAL